MTEPAASSMVEGAGDRVELAKCVVLSIPMRRQPSSAPDRCGGIKGMLLVVVRTMGPKVLEVPESATKFERQDDFGSDLSVVDSEGIVPLPLSRSAHVEVNKLPATSASLQAWCDALPAPSFAIEDTAAAVDDAAAPSAGERMCRRMPSWCPRMPSWCRRMPGWTTMQ